MDDLEDKNNGNMNSGEDSQQSSPDPIGQTSGDLSKPQKKVQSEEIIQDAKMPTSVADATLLPNQFMGTSKGTQTFLSVGDIIELMFRFKWTILVVFLIVTVPAVAAIWTLVVPKYRAQAELRVRPIIPYLVFQTEDSGKIPLYDSFVNTQVSIIMSSAVLQRVLDQSEVQETIWYKKSPKSLMSRLRGSTTSPINRLSNALSARPLKDTEIINVAFINSSAKEAQLIANTVLDQYIKYIGEMSDATGDKIYTQLVDQYKSLENEIQGREQSIAGLRKTLGTGTPDELISGKRIRLDQTQARLDLLQQNITLLEWEMKRDITGDSNDVLAAATDRVQKQLKYYEDVEWRKLDDNVKTIRFNIANSMITAKHPDSVRMEKELEFAEEQLQLREEQLDKQRLDRLNNLAGVSTIPGADSLSYEERLIYMEHQLARLKLEEQLLGNELKKQQVEFAGLFENAQLLDKENNTLLHKRELFSAVRQRLDQKTMERNVPGSIEVLTRASLSSQPYNDRRVAFTVMVLVLALGAGSGLAYLRAGRNQVIYTPKDMPYPMQAPFLGYIPLTGTRRLVGKSLASQYEQTQHDQSSMIESIRIVRTALLSRLNGKDGTTILVTSAAEGTGKTTFTMMLCKSLARSGKKVLLIDTDFKKMTLTKRFGLYDESGLIQSLHQRSVCEWHMYPTDTSGVNFMPAGKQDEDDVEFEEIANGAFKTRLDKLRKQYNIIMLDSSPILAVADATILSSQVDGTIMVERENTSHFSDIINALARLGSAGGHLMGTVFIGSGSYKQYGYK